MNRSKTIHFLLAMIFFANVGAMEEEHVPRKRKSVCSRITRFLLNRSFVISPTVGTLMGMSLQESQENPALAARNAALCSTLSFCLMEYYKARKIECKLRAIDRQQKKLRGSL